MRWPYSSHSVSPVAKPRSCHFGCALASTELYAIENNGVITAAGATSAGKKQCKGPTCRVETTTGLTTTIGTQYDGGDLYCDGAPIIRSL